MANRVRSPLQTPAVQLVRTSELCGNLPVSLSPPRRPQGCGFLAPGSESAPRNLSPLKRIVRGRGRLCDAGERGSRSQREPCTSNVAGTGPLLSTPQLSYFCSGHHHCTCLMALWGDSMTPPMTASGTVPRSQHAVVVRGTGKS